MNRAALRSVALQRLGDPSGQQFSAFEVNEALNVAVRRFSFLTLCVRRSYLLTLTAEHWYKLGNVLPDFLLPLRVRYVSSDVAGTWDTALWDEELWSEDPGVIAASVRVRPAHLSSVIAADQSWETTSGATSKYGVKGWDMLFLDKADETGRLTITYAAQAAAMVTDAQAPEFPEQYHEVQALYAAYRIKVMKQGAQEIAAAMPWRDQWWSAAQAFGARVRRRYQLNGYDPVLPELALPLKGDA